MSIGNSSCLGSECKKFSAQCVWLLTKPTGRNPNLPSVINDKPPALEGTTSSEVVAKNLNALHEARKAFIENETSEKLRRALKHKIQLITSIIYQPGDKVYYKHQDSKESKGPAEVIGHDNHQVFVKQGGLFIRIHPCSLCLIQSPERSITEGEESCVKTSKGCVIDHDQNTVIDSNDDDDLIDEESDKEGNSESLEDMQNNFKARNPQREEPENPEHTPDNDENPDNSLEEERNPTILRNKLPPY